MFKSPNFRSFLQQLLLPFCILTALSYYMQTKFLFSPDVGYLLHITHQIMQGGNYVRDFYETNPPMIFYLYMPAWHLSQWTSLDIFHAFYFYVYAIIFISTGLSNLLLKKIITERDKIIVPMMTFALIFLPLFTHLTEIGQREQMMYLMILPYLFLVAATLMNKPVNRATRVFIGLFAGCGFALKPFFLIPLCLVELYVILRKKNLFACVRIETVMIACVIAAYLASVFLLFPDYLRVLLPLIRRYYFISIKENWAFIFAKPLVDFSVIPVLFYAVFFKKDRYRELSTVLLLAMTGMVTAYMILQCSWFYHILPGFCFGCLLITYYVGMLIADCLQHYTTAANLRREILLLAMMVLVICLPPIYSGYNTMIYRMNVAWRLEVERMTDYINSQPGPHTILDLGLAGTSDSFPLVYLTHGEYAGRFPFVWWYGGLKIREYTATALPQLLQISADKKFLTESMADDLNHFKPHWVIVNLKPGSNWRNDFGGNPKFAAAWGHYQFATTIDMYQLYRRVD